MTLKWFSSYAPVDEEFDNVSLLLHGDGTNGSTTIVDSSSSPKAVTAVGDAQISTAQSKFGGASIAYDGNGDYLYSSSSDYTFRTDPFTIEIWARFNAISDQCLFDSLPLGEPGIRSNAFVLVLSAAGKLDVFSSGSFRGASTTALATGQWYHIALVRSGNTWSYYLNGTYDGGFNYVVDVTTNTFLQGRIGDTAAYYLNGYIDDLRITKGVARYTQNFTPPTAPFPDLSPSGRVTIEDNSLDVDARQYIINVEEQDGQPLESGVRTAINDFVVGCKSDGIWNAIKASCILAGARTLDGALVPLVGGAPTNFNFTAVDYDRKTGLIGNSSNKSLDTNRSVTEDPILNCHISAFYGAGSGVALGSTGGDNNGSGATVLNTTPLGGRLRNNTYTVSSISVVAPSFCGFNRGATNNLTFEARGGGQSQTLSATISSFVGSGNLYTHRFSGVGFDSYSNARLSFYSIGESLPDGPTKTGLELLDERVSNLITAIGAAIL